MTAIPWQKDRHDIGITNIGTDGAGTAIVGMILADDKNGVPIYQVFDDEYLASQYFTGTPGYGALPPEKELAIRQDDWRAGFGELTYYVDDPTRYYSSIGMDLRFKGMAIAGPTPTTVTKPTVPSATATITDADMELSSTAWVGEDSFSGAQYRSGSTSLLITANASTTEAYQMVTPAAYKGIEYVFTCYVYITSNEADMTAKVGIDDGVTATYGSTTSTKSSWVQLTCTKTLSMSATQLKILLWLTAPSAGISSAYWDDAAIACTTTITLGKTSCFAEYNSKLYASFGRVLAKLDSAGTAFDFVADLGAPITDLEVFTDNILYIARGAGTAYAFCGTGEVIVPSTLSNNTMQFFCVVHTTAPTMYGSDSTYQIRSTVNPVNGGTAWSATTSVGGSGYDILNMFSKSGALYIRKQDMPYYLDSSGNVQNDLAPDLASIATKAGDKNVAVWLNKIYFPAGPTLLEYDAGTNTWRSPADYSTDLSEFDGDVQAVAYDERWLFAVVDNAASTEILAGRLETIDSTTPWVWHPIAEITLTGCESAFVSTIYQKRLWISSTDSTENLYYIPLYANYGDVVNDANVLFKTGVTFETPRLHGNFKGDNKAFIKLIVKMGHTFNAGRYFTAKYKKLEDASWTTIGNFAGTTTSMVQSRYIPVDSSSNKPVSTTIQLQFIAVTDDTAYTPVLLDYEVRAILYPPQRNIIACQIRCADEITCKNGQVDHGQHDTIKTTIDNARGANATSTNASWPVSIRDIDGTAKTVKFLAVSPQVVVTKDEKGRRNKERRINLLMQEVALS